MKTGIVRVEKVVMELDALQQKTKTGPSKINQFKNNNNNNL